MLDRNTISDLKQKNVESIRIFFYDAWCSWTKVDLEENPDNSSLSFIKNQDWIDIYSSFEDIGKFNNSIITRTVIADHTWRKKIRYIFSSKKVKTRCGCGSSFSFEEKIPKLDFNKLKDLKNNFKKWI